MGDRANIVFKETGETDLYLYTHSGGYNLPLIVQHALQRGERWSDASYLARIVFCEMIKDDVNGTTGYGISTYLCDSNRPDFEISCENQMIKINGKKITFKDFCVMDEKEIMDIWDD